MSSNPPPIASSSKASAPGPASPALQTPTLNTVNFFGQQRSGSSSTGVSRASPTPRSNQQGKKQHKGSKRFRQTDEDALAESVSWNMQIT
jgi:hypothetical protein